jgi:predicted transcriptional regulator
MFTLNEALVGALQKHGRTYRAPKPRPSGAPHRTGAKVLPDSIEEGTFEDVFFVAPAPGETDRILNAARRAHDSAKKLRRQAREQGRELTRSERMVGLLTAATVRVFEELLTLARLNRGRVYPSYDWLAEATGLGRATVARAITALDTIGFIVRQRRCKRIENHGPGPRYEQTSNVYRAFLPKFILAFLPRWMKPAPIPVDQEQREAERIEATAGMLASLSCRELATTMFDGQLAKVMAKLGAGVDRQERESQIDAQPRMDSYDLGISGVGLVGQRLSA